MGVQGEHDTQGLQGAQGATGIQGVFCKYGFLYFLGFLGKKVLKVFYFVPISLTRGESTVLKLMHTRRKQMKNPTVIAAIKGMVEKHNEYYTKKEPKASKRVKLEVVNGGAKFTAGANMESQIHHWAYEAGKSAWEEAIGGALEKFTGKKGKNKISIERDEKYFQISLVVTGPSGHTFKALEIKAAPGGEGGRDKSDPIMSLEYKPSDQMTVEKESKKINFKDAYSAESNAKLRKKVSEIIEPVAEKTLNLAEKYLERMAEKHSKVTVKL